MVNNLVVCGGTFDHFHKGHKSFLKYAFSLSKKLIIGVTSDDYIRSSKFKIQNSKFIEPFGKRKRYVNNFLEQKKVLDRVEVVKIDDLFGSTLDKNLSIDAIVVSENTKKGADIINQRRKEIDLNPFKIFIAPIVPAEDGKPISSARIRKGEINRRGENYVKSVWLNEDIKLTKKLRKEFQRPFGELLKDIDSSFGNKNCLVVTVGDVTTKIFNEKSLSQNISVIDYKIAREKRFSKLLELGFTGNENVLQADNPAGYITSDLFKKLTGVFKLEKYNKTVLLVNGEEDLAVLPLILLAPLNTVIYYGQPHEGVVRVEVSEMVKNKAYSLILKLKQAQ